MRGARHPWSCSSLRMRIIPAYAGSTLVREVVRCNNGDHPRVCGEHLLRRYDWTRHKGIIPAYAGSTGTEVRDPRPLGGIIPAYAGSTLSYMSPEERDGDHPRVCGEHLFRNCEPAFCAGSSPRMRGALSTALSSVSQLGIIPAYAGSTTALAAHRSV